MGEGIIKVEYIIPESLEKEIAEKISKQVKEAYYWSVTKAVSDKVIEQLNADGFTSRVAKAISEKIKISEDDYISGVTDKVKDSVMKTTGIIAKEILEKVQKTVQSYGFIKVGKDY